MRAVMFLHFCNHPIVIIPSAAVRLSDMTVRKIPRRRDSVIVGVGEKEKSDHMLT